MLKKIIITVLIYSFSNGLSFASESVAIADTQRVSVAAAQANMASANILIHYMADLGHLNAANPHTIPSKPSSFAESSASEAETGRLEQTGEQATKDMIRTPGVTSLDSILVKPDKLKYIGFKKDGTAKKTRSAAEINLTPYFVVGDDGITLRDWLRLKLSVVAWENDRRYRRIVPHLLAILIENEPEKVDMVKEFIRSISPYTMKTREQSDKSGTYGGLIRGAVSGSNKKTFVAEFDDFTITNWTRLLCMANEGKIQLDEETKTHIMNHLLMLEGEQFDDAIPNTNNFIVKDVAALTGFRATDGGIENSENHVLMINSSAYIKNQMTDSNRNSGSELEIKLCAYLDKLYQEGLTEFNSIPYAGHTIDALLNLHDFAHEPVKSRATRVLDKIFYDYVIHSTRDGKAFRPFVRLEKNGANQSFSVDDQIRAFMTPWLGMDPRYYLKEGQSGYSVYAFTGLTTTYRLPTVVYELATKNTGGYLALTGQPHGNAEVSYKNNYGDGKQYLLSGGGLRGENTSLSRFNNITTSVFHKLVERENEDAIAEDADIRTRREAAEVVSRNPVLILSGEDHASELKESIYLGTENAISETGGPGIDSRGKNNSGIYFDTLVGAYPVHIPDRFREKAIRPQHDDLTAQSWALYEMEPGLRVAVFDARVLNSNGEHEQVGIVLVLPGFEPTDSQALINTIADENKNPQTIYKHVKFPDDCGSVMRGQTLKYNLSAQLDRYVITGFGDKHWEAYERIFYPKPMRDKDKPNAPGWSALSAIQSGPDDVPRCLIDPENAAYSFLKTDGSAAHL